jgi:selenocysteine lyase/cysteine desulfurase
MTITAADLYRTPNALAPHYSRFDVANRLLLTGHSHQAWPDRAFDGQMQAWLGAARYVDEKWEQAFARADRVRLGYARLLDDVGGSRGSITLAESTHELLVRLLSALPLRERPRLVTTTAEFHTIRRQLDRLEEEGIEIVRIDADPVPDLAARLAAAVDDRTAAILVSSVFFLSARIVPGLGEVMAACRRVGAELVVDVYHHLNVVPFSLRAEGLEEAYVVGGGYKYCQLGEGNAFLRVPRDCKLRPVITGWFSEFSAIATAGGQRATPYGTGADRFAGATYDPTSNYRAAAVFDFFDEHALPPTLLREVSQHQVGLLAAGFDALDLDPALVDRDRDVDLSEIGGFLALRSPRAGDLCAGLRERGVMADYRGDVLRLGPAPYLSDAQLEDAVAALGESAAAAGRSATLGRSATTLRGDAGVVDAGAARR